MQTIACSTANTRMKSSIESPNYPEYSLASGQRIYYQKSSIYFGKNIPAERREAIKQKLGIEQTGGDGIYLGLPESFGGSKISIMSFLKEKMELRMNGWQNKVLSTGGKEVLLKVVTLALPTYTMSCFLPPKDDMHADCLAVFKLLVEE